MHVQTYNTSRPWGLIAAVALFFLVTPAWAQGEHTEAMTEAQIEAYSRALSLADTGDFEASLPYLREAVRRGSKNIVYLQLGRVLAHLDRCEEAFEAYGRAATAQRVPDPSPDQVWRLLKRYTSELGARCSGRIVPQCDAKNVTLQIGDGVRFICSRYAHGARVVPGEHRVEIAQEDGTDTQIVGVLAGESVALHVAAKPGPIEEMSRKDSGAVERPESAPAPKDVVSSPEPWRIYGWGGAGVGGALLVAAILIDRLVLAPDFEAYNKAATTGDRAQYDDLKKSIDAVQGLNVFMIVVGTVATVAGLTAALTPTDLLFFWEREGSPPAASLTLTPSVGPEKTGLSLRLTW